MPFTPNSISGWSQVLEKIRAGSASAVEELYKSLRPIRFYFGRQIRPDRGEDAYHKLLTCAASESPEQLVFRSEKQAIAERVLKELPPRQRETLIRFYLDGESEEEITAAMGMSHSQFRLIKSRAKKKWGELVQQSINKRPKRKARPLCL